MVKRKMTLIELPGARTGRMFVQVTHEWGYGRHGSPLHCVKFMSNLMFSIARVHSLSVPYECLQQFQTQHLEYSFSDSKTRETWKVSRAFSNGPNVDRSRRWIKFNIISYVRILIVNSEVEKGERNTLRMALQARWMNRKGCTAKPAVQVVWCRIFEKSQLQ